MIKIIKFININIGYVLSFISIIAFFSIVGTASFQYLNKNIFNLSFYLIAVISYLIIISLNFMKPENKIVFKKNNVFLGIILQLIFFFSALLLYKAFLMKYDISNQNYKLYSLIIIIYGILAFLIPLSIIRKINHLEIDYFGFSH